MAIDPRHEPVHLDIQALPPPTANTPTSELSLPRREYTGQRPVGGWNEEPSLGSLEGPMPFPSYDFVLWRKQKK